MARIQPLNFEIKKSWKILDAEQNKLNAALEQKTERGGCFFRFGRELVRN